MTSASISSIGQPKAATRPAPDAALITAVAEKSALVMARLNTIIDRHPNVVLANSLGAEDMVLMDMICKDNLPIGIFTLDTGRLNEETYALLAKAQQQYGRDIEIMTPDYKQLEPWVREHGINGFYQSVEQRKACCAVRKIEPLKRAPRRLGLKDFDPCTILVNSSLAGGTPKVIASGQPSPGAIAVDAGNVYWINEGSFTKADGATLRGRTGPVTVRLQVDDHEVPVRSVIAQTKTGSTGDVVMAGAHLDSVEEGPGINDNGSGTAALLETALQLGPSPQVHNAVRFAFWGAEERGLVGSEKYIESLNIDQLRDIALYLNFDMLASPNPGYFTYDGDQSTKVPRDERVPRVPEGSPAIERLLVAYLDSAGKTAQDTSFDGRSDYDGFTLAGIPAGGLFAGAEENMNDEQAKLWNGRAGQPFDPNYHKATDTIEHIDRTALDIQGGGVGYAIGFYATDVTGRTGVPPRDERTRHVVEPK